VAYKGRWGGGVCNLKKKFNVVILIWERNKIMYINYIVYVRII
jgi:hypothetical protein